MENSLLAVFLCVRCPDGGALSDDRAAAAALKLHATCKTGGNEAEFMQYRRFSLRREQLGSQLRVIDSRKEGAGPMTKETGNGHGVGLT